MSTNPLRYLWTPFRGWFVIFSYSGEKSDAWFRRALSYVVRSDRVLLSCLPLFTDDIDHRDGLVVALYGKVGIGPTRFDVSISRSHSSEPSVDALGALSGVLSATARVFDYEFFDYDESVEYRRDFQGLLFGPCAVSPDSGRRYFSFLKNELYDPVLRSSPEFVPSSLE